METAVAAPARFVADLAGAFPLRDVEDLHDADLESVLSDRLLDAEVAAASARVLAELVGGPGPAVIFAHKLSAQAPLLAVL